jgi:hypothetical protein
MAAETTDYETVFIDSSAIFSRGKGTAIFIALYQRKSPVQCKQQRIIVHYSRASSSVVPLIHCQFDIYEAKFKADLINCSSQGRSFLSFSPQNSNLLIHI